MFYSPSSSSFFLFPSLPYSFLSFLSPPLFWCIVISALADLSSLTIPYEEEDEEGEEEETYDDIDGLDSQNSGSQCRPIILPGSLGLKQPTEEKEEDIYEVLPGEKLHLLITFL